MLEVNGEIIVERTIRLLRENGIEDIAISTNNPDFDFLDVEKLKHKNDFVRFNKENNKKSQYTWLNAYYPIDEPACYLHGDVYYSDEAIKTIIETPVKNTMFFCTRDLSDGRPAGVNPKGREPLAYKVENQQLFRKAINDIFKMIDDGKFAKGIEPISWHLYRYINGFDLMYDAKGYNANDIFRTKGDYIYIDDYSTDIDEIKDIEKLEKFIKLAKEVENMVKVEVIKEFHLGRFNELKNLVRKNPAKNMQGYLFVGDVFECEEDLAKYLANEEGHKNPGGKAFVIKIEVIPEPKKKEVKKVEPVEEEVKPKRTTRRKRAVAKK